MQLTSKIQKAIKIAAEKHAGQVRQVDGLPFVVHLFEVAWVLSNYSNDENVIAAGLIHSVVNNVDDYSLVDIKNDFGELIMAMVFLSAPLAISILSNKLASWIIKTLGL